MKIHLQRELDALRKRVFHLCSLVEDNLAMAIQAVQKPDDGAAEVIRRRDREIEQLRARAEKAEAELARTRAALDLVGKAHALLETLSESAEPPRRSPR